MIAYIILVLAIGIFEIIMMYRKNLHKEIVVYAVISLLAIAFAVYYYGTSPDSSLSRIVLDFLNIEQ